MNHNAKLGGMHLGRKAAAPITPCVETAPVERDNLLKLLSALFEQCRAGQHREDRYVRNSSRACEKNSPSRRRGIKMVRFAVVMVVLRSTLTARLGVEKTSWLTVIELQLASEPSR
jgi:hypothetical protein